MPTSLQLCHIIHHAQCLQLDGVSCIPEQLFIATKGAASSRSFSLPHWDDILDILIRGVLQIKVIRLNKAIK